MTVRTLDSHIEMTPGICGGKPRIAGRRIRVVDVVRYHDQLGQSPSQIAEDYHLTLSDVHAALAYYHDHKAEIDQCIADDEAFAEEMQSKTPSKLAARLTELGRNGEHS